MGNSKRESGGFELSPSVKIIVFPEEEVEVEIGGAVRVVKGGLVTAVGGAAVTNVRAEKRAVKRVVDLILFVSV